VKEEQPNKQYKAHLQKKKGTPKDELKNREEKIWRKQEPVRQRKMGVGARDCRVLNYIHHSAHGAMVLLTSSTSKEAYVAV